VTIHVAGGTYPNVIYTPTYAGPVITLNGAGVTSTYLTGQNNNDTVIVQGANTLVVQNVHVSTGTGVGPPSGLVASSGGLLVANAINAGNCASGCYETYGGYMSINGPHIQDAGTSMGALIESLFAGQMTIVPGAHFTFNGAFSVSSFVSAGGLGVIISDTQVNGPPIFINPGNVTGAKYGCSQNGVCTVVGQGVNLFPGSTPGSVNTGGQYG
jgi:hypothetical protein